MLMSGGGGKAEEIIGKMVVTDNLNINGEKDFCGRVQ